jgi:hypothetical protein
VDAATAPLSIIIVGVGPVRAGVVVSFCCALSFATSWALLATV